MSCTLLSDCCNSKSKRNAWFWPTWMGSNSMYSDFYTHEFCLSQRLPHPVLEYVWQVPMRLRYRKPTFESSLDWRAELQGQTHMQDSCGGLERGEADAHWLQMAALGLSEQWYRSTSLLAILVLAKLHLTTSGLFLPLHSPPRADTSQLSASLSTFPGSLYVGWGAITCVAAEGVRCTVGKTKTQNYLTFIFLKQIKIKQTI